MSLEQDIIILKDEYALDDSKDDYTFFKPKRQIDKELKERVKEQYKVFLKSMSDKIRVSGSNPDSRIKAIIELVGLHKEEEEIVEEQDFDDDSIELLQDFGKSSADRMKEIAESRKKQEQEDRQRQYNLFHTHSQQQERTDQQSDHGRGRGYQGNRNQRSDNRNNNNNFDNNNHNNRNINNNRNNYKQNPKRTNSGPQQSPNQQNPHQQNRPTRFRSSDNSQTERQRGPTPNYKNLHNNENQNEKNTDNQGESVNEDNENPQFQRGRGRRRGQGRGRGRYERGRRGGRAPLGPRISVIESNDRTSNQTDQNNTDNIQATDNQHGRQQNPNYRRPNNNDIRGKRNNRSNRGNDRGNRGRRQQPRPNQEMIQQPQSNPIPPEEITYKEESTIEITPQLKHTLMIMDNQITPETSEQEILNIKWFHLEKLLNPINEENLEPGTLMNAPYLLVEFLIESFAIDQPEQFHCIEHKNFENKQLMHLNMPFPMPLTFQTEGDKIQVGFFNSSNFSSEEMNELCSTVLTTLSQRSMLVFTISEVDREVFSFSYLENLSKELDFIYLRSIPEENDEMETISFTIKIMKYNWSLEKETAIQNRIAEMFNDASIFECKKCGCTYSPSDGSKCYKTIHSGKRIPFPDTHEMELYDEAEDGQPVLLYCYTCCGEVEADAPGCVATEEENGSHEPFEETNSRMSIETLPIYS